MQYTSRSKLVSVNYEFVEVKMSGIPIVMILFLFKGFELIKVN